MKKIATREALFRRRILRSQTDKCCVLCFEEDETALHLFLQCRVTKMVWQQVFSWLGETVDETDDLISHFMEFGRLLKGKKQRGVKHLIWLALVWNRKCPML